MSRCLRCNKLMLGRTKGYCTDCMEVIAEEIAREDEEYLDALSCDDLLW